MRRPVICLYELAEELASNQAALSEIIVITFMWHKRGDLPTVCPLMPGTKDGAIGSPVHPGRSYTFEEGPLGGQEKYEYREQNKDARGHEPGPTHIVAPKELVET